MADTTKRDKTARKKLDEAVAKAQADEIKPGVAESADKRAARIKRDREAVEARHAAVADAQAAAPLLGLDDDGQYTVRPKPETEAERVARIEAGRQAVLDRQAAVVAAVDAENAKRAKALGHG